MSGGLILSIKDLRKARFRDGPGKKNPFLATPFGKRLISHILISFYVRNTYHIVIVRVLPTFAFLFRGGRDIF